MKSINFDASLPVVQWQKRHPDYDDGVWKNTNEADAKWWRDHSSVRYEARALVKLADAQAHARWYGSACVEAAELARGDVAVEIARLTAERDHAQKLAAERLDQMQVDRRQAMAARDYAARNSAAIALEMSDDVRVLTAERDAALKSEAVYRQLCDDAKPFAESNIALRAERDGRTDAEISLADGENVLALALVYFRWLKREGRGSTFSTFVNELPYDHMNASSVYPLVMTIIDAAITKESGK